MMGAFLEMAFTMSFVIEAIVIFYVVIKSIKDNKPTEINWRTWKELGVYKSNKSIK